jgi:1,4-alpha-glucan branching enzyme
MLWERPPANRRPAGRSPIWLRSRVDYMGQRCGAWQVGDDPTGGAIEFKLFIPDGPDPGIEAIRVAGSFQGWDFPGGLAMTRDDSQPDGTIWTARTPRLDAGFYEYKYAVDFTGGETRKVSDPCTRYGGFGNQNAAVVVGGSRPADNVVRPLPGGRLPLQDLNLYELMIDDFTSGYRAARAPLDAVVDRLDYLRDHGFNAIQFMPWTAWHSDEFDWGYVPFQYFSVEAHYAHDLLRPEEKLSWLKRLVSECHDRGIHVIMDGVFNHVSRDFPYKYLYRDPDACPYTSRPFGGSFDTLQDLDFDQPCTRELIRDVCRYWIQTFGIDGIRFDNTVNFYVAGSTHGLPGLLADVRDAAAAPFSLTLEHIDVSAVEVIELTGATSYWDNALFGVTFGALWDGRVDQKLLNALNTRRWLRSGDKVPTLYLTNHDHSHVAWQAGARRNEGALGGWFKTQPFAIALFTSTAVPLIPNGQEFGEDHFLPEDDQKTGRRVIARPLRWKLADDRVGQALRHVYRTLARLRRDHPGLRSPHMYPPVWDEWQTQLNPVGVGVDVARQVAVYHRWAMLPGGGAENFVIALNFSDETRRLNLPFPLDGAWTDLLNQEAVAVAGNRLELPVAPNWGRILRKD